VQLGGCPCQSRLGLAKLIFRLGKLFPRKNRARHSRRITLPLRLHAGSLVGESLLLPPDLQHRMLLLLLVITRRPHELVVRSLQFDLPRSRHAGGLLLVQGTLRFKAPLGRCQFSLSRLHFREVLLFASPQRFYLHEHLLPVLIAARLEVRFSLAHRLNGTSFAGA